MKNTTNSTTYGAFWNQAPVYGYTAVLGRIDCRPYREGLEKKTYSYGYGIPVTVSLPYMYGRWYPLRYGAHP